MQGVTAVTRSVRVEPGILIQIFPLWLLEWSCNGLKSFSRGLRNVKEGGISARKVAQMWKCWDWAWRNQAQDCRSDKMGEWPLTVGRALLHFFFFLTKNQKQKKKKPVGRLANWACKQGLELVLGWVLSSVKNFLSKEVGIYTVLRQQARKVVSEFHHFFIPSPFIKLSSSQYTIFPIKIYCVSLTKRAFSVRVPYNSHIVINLLEAVWL